LPHELGHAAFLVLMDGGTLLHAARLSRRPLRSPMVISGLPITAVCTRTRRAALPPDVTVPR
jgi:hypothetical protein